jgi:hypothetical protein
MALLKIAFIFEELKAKINKTVFQRTTFRYVKKGEHLTLFGISYILSAFNLFGNAKSSPVCSPGYWNLSSGNMFASRALDIHSSLTVLQLKPVTQPGTGHALA